MKAVTVVPQTFNICSCMALNFDTMTLDLSYTGLWWLTQVLLQIKKIHH